MTRLPRVTATEVFRKLQRAGFAIVRSSGSPSMRLRGPFERIEDARDQIVGGQPCG